jgi:hypothetical protein
VVGGGRVGDLDEVDAAGVAVVVDGLQGIEDLAALAGFGIIWGKGHNVYNKYMLEFSGSSVAILVCLES